MEAQSTVTSRQVNLADSSQTRPRLGDTVTITGRVTLGAGALDTMRLRIYVQDAAGGTYVYVASGQRTLNVIAGDSVVVRGVIARFRNRTRLTDATVAIVPTERRIVPPVVPTALRDPVLDSLRLLRVSVEGNVASVRMGRGTRLIELVNPSDSTSAEVDVVDVPSRRLPLQLERFSPGDRVRATGVLSMWQNPATGERRHTLYVDNPEELHAIGLTRQQKMRWIVGATALLLLGVVAFWLVTARRNAAKQRQHREQAARELRESEERFRLVSQATKDVVWEWDITTGRTFWSENVHALLGHTIAEMEGEIATRSRYVHPDDQPRVLAGVERALASAGQSSWSDEYRYRRPDDSYATVFDRAYIVRDAQGRATRMIGAIHDLTERLQLEEQLRHSQKMESVGQLAAGIAHDFNNVLTAIRTFSELVMADLPADSPSRQDVAQIQLAGSRAALLTRQLLTFSRREPQQPRVVDVNDVIREVEQLLRGTVREQVAMRINLANGPCAVLADAGELTQVIMNLVINARDAMAGRDGVLTIETAVLSEDELPARARPPRPGSHVMLQVSDTGTGMDEATQRKIFDPFFTTKPAGVGTGLGLSSVYGIVTRAGGTVLVDSSPGNGATFTVLVPATQAAPTIARREVPAEEGRAAGLILVIEDEAPVRLALSRLLTRRGYGILDAASAPEALEHWQAHRNEIRAVVTDVMLPGMSGPKLVEMLRAERLSVPVLFMSGYTDDVLSPAMLAQPHTSFIVKPFGLDNLAGMLEELLAEAEGNGTDMETILESTASVLEGRA